MRSTIGVLLAVLISPLAQAELIDEIADRGELRIAVQATTALRLQTRRPPDRFRHRIGQALAKELDLRAEFVEARLPKCWRVSSGKYDIAFTRRVNRSLTTARSM
jgi:ABC-type amino acid transport substrate-binding protein